MSGVGAKPRYTLMAMGVQTLVAEGLVIDAASSALYGRPLKGILKVPMPCPYPPVPANSLA